MQEVDLCIHYRPGKANANADALSRAPLPSAPVDTVVLGPSIAAVSAGEGPLHPAKDGEGGLAGLAERQRQDTDLLADGTLPDCEKLARELVLGRAQYELVDSVWYHVEANKILRVVPPRGAREKLFQEAHLGAFGAHLKAAKLHGELGKHYWWKGMRADVTEWCKACLTCATRQPGSRAERPPLTPIPVAGPFDRLGVDVIHFLKSFSSNQYAVVLMDYLTKWPEVFPVPDQSALTIAKLLIEKVISRHGVPAELLSDQGAAFLSKLLREVCELMVIHKLNTTAYHPQTDGLVERFNCTLTDMLAKKVERSGQDWDTQFPFVLFAYRASPQESTGESPFFLVHGQDPRLPSELTLDPPAVREPVDLDSYKSEVAVSL